MKFRTAAVPVLLAVAALFFLSAGRLSSWTATLHPGGRRASLPRGLLSQPEVRENHLARWCNLSPVLRHFEWCPLCVQGVSVGSLGLEHYAAADLPPVVESSYQVGKLRTGTAISGASYFTATAPTHWAVPACRAAVYGGPRSARGGQSVHL